MIPSSSARSVLPGLRAVLACLERPTAAPAVGWLDGLRLDSHFQPIFSLSHGRVVGHEALLRATDAHGAAVPPSRFFGVDAFESLCWRDRVVRALHAANYARVAPAAQWLFLNMHPQVFLRAAQDHDDGFLEQFFAHFGLAGPQVVFEVLEEAVQDDSDFTASCELLRSRGCLIALDDFGAGHSNFDRVWRLRPEIVKLDRSLVAHAAVEPRARRVVVQMVSLLHECGALVLMEGVETEAEAFVALESDADLVQGWYFARPQPGLVADDHAGATLGALWSGFGGRWRDQQSAYRERIAPYRNGIGYAAALLAGGRPLADAVQSFLQLPDAEVCYLLGPDGWQIGAYHWGERVAQAAHPAFEPCATRAAPAGAAGPTSAARWRRPDGCRRPGRTARCRARSCA
jgi:EAL domain-containing protein (putative c-di-GMP-specific phosphodiesterase class I)